VQSSACGRHTCRARPDAVQLPTADIPADPNPTRTFDGATVLTNFQLYRRLISGFVYFNVQGTIKSVPIVNTSEWYFFPTGRTLVRFRNYRAGFPYPNTVVDVSDSWVPIGGTIACAARHPSSLRRQHPVHRDRRRRTDGDDTRERAPPPVLEQNFQILSEWACEQRPSGVRCRCRPVGDC
jgi:hypothetical protein